MRFDEIAAYYNEADRNNTEFRTEFVKKFGDVLSEGLIDAIRISICFENYFKSKLFLNDFIIHTIRKEVNEALFKEQKFRPIQVKEILTGNMTDDLSSIKLHLKEQTINYSTLLEKQDYYKYFAIEKDIIDFLIYLNGLRNRLHLYSYAKGKFSQRIIENYSKLIKIVDLDLVLLQNVLCNEVVPESKSRIPFNFDSTKL